MNNRYFKHKALLYSIAAMIFSFMGCQDVVDLSDQIDAQPKLVLYCRICPQLDSTYVLLTASNVLYSTTMEGNYSYNDTYQKVLKDGIVELSSDGNTWKRAVYNEARQQYLITQSDLPIIEGHTYYIRASHDGYPDVSASCTVPFAREVNFHFDTVTVQSDVHWGEVWDEEHQDLYAEWTDIPGEENYYMLVNKNLITDYYYSYNEETQSYETDSIAYRWSWGMLGLEDEKENFLTVFSDEGRDGQKIRGLYEAFFEEREYDEDQHNERYYSLVFIDKNNYLYEKTLYDSEFSFLSNFMLEPLHTYSNIENGFGLFGAFSMLAVR